MILGIEDCLVLCGDALIPESYFAQTRQSCGKRTETAERWKGIYASEAYKGCK